MNELNGRICFITFLIIYGKHLFLLSWHPFPLLLVMPFSSLYKKYHFFTLCSLSFGHGVGWGGNMTLTPTLRPGKTVHSLLWDQLFKDLYVDKVGSIRMNPGIFAGFTGKVAPSP